MRNQPPKHYGSAILAVYLVLSLKTGPPLFNNPFHLSVPTPWLWPVQNAWMLLQMKPAAPPGPLYLLTAVLPPRGPFLEAFLPSLSS